MILLTVKLRSSLSEKELLRIAEERAPEFRAIPGLLQKYYVHDPSSDERGGVYVWDSQESLDEYLASDLRKSIPETYEIVGAPRVETIPVIDTLR